MANTITIRGETVVVIETKRRTSMVFTDTDKAEEKIAAKSSKHRKIHLRVGKYGAVYRLPYGANTFEYMREGDQHTIATKGIGVFQKP